MPGLLRLLVESPCFHLLRCRPLSAAPDVADEAEDTETEKDNTARLGDRLGGGLGDGLDREVVKEQDIVAKVTLVLKPNRRDCLPRASINPEIRVTPKPRPSPVHTGQVLKRLAERDAVNVEPVVGYRNSSADGLSDWNPPKPMPSELAPGP